MATHCSGNNIIDEERFLWTSEKYLEHCNVLKYFSDAISQLLQYKDENPKADPAQFLAEYFSAVKAGNHIMFREFAYIRATEHNRACFIQLFWKCFKNIGRKGDLLSTAEYHSLICLLCSDFPLEYVQKIVRIVQPGDSGNMSFTDFLLAMQLQLCFEEFIAQGLDMVKLLVKSSTSAFSSPSVSDGPHLTEQVSSAELRVAFTPLCDRTDIWSPPLAAVDEALPFGAKVSFVEFLHSLANNSRVNFAIGKLPARSDLLTVTEQELATNPLAFRSVDPVPPFVTSTPLPQPGQSALVGLAEASGSGSSSSTAVPGGSTERGGGGQQDRRQQQPLVSDTSVELRHLKQKMRQVRRSQGEFVPLRPLRSRSRNNHDSDDDDDDDDDNGDKSDDSADSSNN